MKLKNRSPPLCADFSSKSQLTKEYADILEKEPQKPLINKRIYSDSTIESLLFELSQSRVGGLLTSTEAGNLLSPESIAITPVA